MSFSKRLQHQVLMSYAILAIVLAALMSVVLGVPIGKRAAFFAGLDTRRTIYAKSLESLSRSEAVRRQFEALQATSDASEQVFHAATPALAGADLQNQINTLVAAESGQLLSSAFREASAEGPLTPIIVTIRLRCSIEALVRILHGLENRSPVLFVEDFTVQANRRANRPRGNGDLDVELAVLGLLETPAAL